MPIKIKNDFKRNKYLNNSSTANKLQIKSTKDKDHNMITNFPRYV